MLLGKSFFGLFKKDNELYVAGYGDEYLRHATQHRIFIAPGKKIGSLPAVKRELRKSIQEREAYRK